MTDAHDTETLAEVLAAHWEIDVIEDFYTCDCGRVLGENGVTPGDEVDPRHRAHVAEALASRIEQARAGEGALRERVEAAIRLISPDHITPIGVRQLRAALTDTAGDLT